MNFAGVDPASARVDRAASGEHGRGPTAAWLRTLEWAAIVAGSMENRFELVSNFKPCGDQPRALEEIGTAYARGDRFQVLLGVTGSGKTFTAAKTIETLQKPTLVLAPNKT